MTPAPTAAPSGLKRLVVVGHVKVRRIEPISTVTAEQQGLGIAVGIGGGKDESKGVPRADLEHVG